MSSLVPRSITRKKVEGLPQSTEMTATFHNRGSALSTLRVLPFSGRSHLPRFAGHSHLAPSLEIQR